MARAISNEYFEKVAIRRANGQVAEVASKRNG
jgi:hypothetical protein